MTETTHGLERALFGLAEELRTQIGFDHEEPLSRTEALLLLQLVELRRVVDAYERITAQSKHMSEQLMALLREEQS